MPQNKALRYFLFGSLYFAQGSLMSYITALNAIYLLSFDLSMSQIGLFSAVSLIPMVLKIFLGMLSDRVNLLGQGNRKPYIVLGLIIQSICLLMVPFIHPGQNFGLFLVLALVMVSGMALYDTCTDGLALDTTPVEEQGTIQGFMVGGRALGVVLISAVMGLVVQRVSWQAGFWMLAVITLLPLPVILGVREPQRRAGRDFQWAAFRSFGRKQVLALSLISVVYTLVIYGANQNVNPFLQQRFSIDATSAGMFTSVWGLGMILGGITGGRLTDRIGRRRAIRGALFASSLAIGALALISNQTLAWILVFLFGLAFGYYDTVFLAFSMEMTDPRIAASMFSILMALGNVGIGLGFAISGKLADQVGFPITFGALAVVNLLVLFLLPPLFAPSAVKKAKTV